MIFNQSSLGKTDGYKLSHRLQYVPGTTLVYSNLTARKSRYENIDYYVFYGLQYFIKEYLLEQWNKDFFSQPLPKVIQQYKRRIDNYLGPNNHSYEHIEYLHKLGYLPLIIKAVKEGTKLPIGVPCLTLYNTDPKCFWLTNYLETMLSCSIWKMCNNATVSYYFKTVFEKYYELTGANKDLIPYMGHDFSFRGMSSYEDSCTSGSAFLLSFYGTDTIPAIDFLEKYYNADSDKEVIGTSVSASEHSCMASYSKEQEYEAFHRLITKVHPTGILSIVSDTYSYWDVITNFLPKLKPDILNRFLNNKDIYSKVVIRPDSGDPYKIVVGDENASTEHERKGTIQCLYELFGGNINQNGYVELHPCIGVILGDGVTMELQERILKGLMKKQFASSNICLGIGSYTLNYSTRDNLNFAIKATHCVVDGKGRDIFKNPATDTGMKKSHKGLMRLNADKSLDQEITWEEEKGGILEEVFVNGKLVREQSLRDIRELLAQQ